MKVLEVCVCVNKKKLTKDVGVVVAKIEWVHYLLERLIQSSNL